MTDTTPSGLQDPEPAFLIHAIAYWSPAGQYTLWQVKTAGLDTQPARELCTTHQPGQ